MAEVRLIKLKVKAGSRRDCTLRRARIPEICVRAPAAGLANQAALAAWAGPVEAKRLRIIRLDLPAKIVQVYGQ